MMSPTRLELLEVLSDLSEQFPEVRLGQLISNLATLAKGPQVEAIWDVEDKELLEAAKRQLEIFRMNDHDLDTDKRMLEIFPKIRVVKVADAFLFSACKLFDNRSDVIDWFYPFYANLAFSIELYLKSYIVEDDLIPIYMSVNQIFLKPIKKHKLEKIYQKIDDVVKKELNEKFSNSNLSEKFINLYNALSQFSNVFIEARYPFEKIGLKNGCVSDIFLIAQFMKGAIYEIGEFIKDNKTNKYSKRC